MSTPKIYLKPGKEQSIQRFHPWIFSGAVKKIEGNPADGDVVEVYSDTNNFLAVGHYQQSSITVRILDFNKNEITQQFWQNKIKEALTLRRSIGLYPNPDTNIFRLIHGEGDNLPGLVVDIYGNTAVMQCHSAGMYRSRNDIAKAIVAEFDEEITAVYDKSAGTLNLHENFSPTDKYIVGQPPAEKVFFEHGCKFEVSWEEGQKTGFFVDQRENRKLIEQFAKGRDVLNTFGYTGGFSVYAMHGGANSVVTVDSSEKAIDLANRNIELNFPNTALHKGIVADAFDFLKSSNQKYDLIILDPPAFAKHTHAIKNALQAYKRLNLAAIRNLKPNGILFTFSCSQVVSRTDFRNAVFSASAISGRKVSILHQLTQPADHPINIYHPEGEYLKGLVLEVK